MNKAVFLDRDGVVNIDHGYVYKVSDFEFVPGILELCRRYRKLGYKLIIVTNQSGIGRGYYTREDFEQLTLWLERQFVANHSPLAAVYHCPHAPDAGCDCRKPLPGMLLQAAKEHDIDCSQSIMIGDKLSDMQAAMAAGVGTRVLFANGGNDTDTAVEITHKCSDLSQLP